MNGTTQQTGNSHVAIHIPLLRCMEIPTQDALRQWATFFQSHLPFWPPQKPCRHKWWQDAVPPKEQNYIRQIHWMSHLLGTKKKCSHFSCLFLQPVSSRAVLDFDFVGGNPWAPHASGSSNCTALAVMGEASASVFSWCPSEERPSWGSRQKVTAMPCLPGTIDQTPDFKTKLIHVLPFRQLKQNVITFFP